MGMTQEEHWIKNYEEVVEFIRTNHRNLSKYKEDERTLFTWVKHNRKVMNKGELKPERLKRFEELMKLCERYRRVNQYK